MKTHYLLEVGAKGNLKVDMENGKCIFSGLKFNTTSYNHDVKYFKNRFSINDFIL